MSALTTREMIMNGQGLVVNSFQDAAGRGDYFSGSSGTSEGQFLFILGMLDAYRATGNVKALAQAQKALGNVLTVLYRNMQIPPQVTEQAAFAPHWLFSAKYPFNSAIIRYDGRVTFSGGVGYITSSVVRKVFNARSLDAEYLWQNPYSVLKSGTLYPVASTEYIAGTGQKVTLTTPYTGDLLVTYSTEDGPIIRVNEPYEAWPDWRKLDPSEIDAACDVFIWAWRTFQTAYEVTGEAIWRDAARATLEQAHIANDINDSRDWLKPTWSDSPFSEGARFSFVNRTPSPAFSVADGGYVQIGVPTQISGTGVVQYGKASLMDVYGDNDTTTVEIGSNRAMTVTLYIDETATYDPSRRWMKIVSLKGTGLETFTFNRLDFVRSNSVSVKMPANTPVYTAGIEARSPFSFTLFIRRIRQNPALDIPYYPGAIPFTANFMGNPPMLIDWRGPVYAGYQAPPIWLLNSDRTGAENCLLLLRDAQDAWVAQTGKPRGPFAPVFYFPRDDAVQYGAKNTFGWNGPDPNTVWGGYQYRPLAEAAETVWIDTVGTTAYNLGAQIATDFISYLASESIWPSAPVQGPPTEFPMSGSWRGYDEPHMACLIWRAVIKMDWKRRITAGEYSGMLATHTAITNKTVALLDHLWVTTGIMAGTFSNNPAGHEWYGFWHGEILSTLALAKQWAQLPQVNNPTLAQKCTLWMAGLVQWSTTNTARGSDEDGSDGTTLDTSAFWPFTPDWVDGLTEAWEFQTNIITSFDGTEQRKGKRQEPRRELTMNYTLTTQSAAANYQAIVSSRLNRAMYLPQWHAGARLAVGAGVAAESLTLDREHDDTMVEGSAISIQDSEGTHITWIRWVSGNTITLNDGLPRPFAAGSRVAVSFLAVLDPSVTANRLAASVMQAQAHFLMMPQDDQRKLPVIAAPQTFTVGTETRELVSIRPNWANTPTIEDSWVYNLSSYVDGPVTPMAGEDFGRRSLKATFSMFSAAERVAFEGLLNRLRGRQIACWVSSWTRDFEMAGQTGAANTLLVEYNAFLSEGLWENPWMGICIHTVDGAMMCARIQSVAKVGNTATLTLDRNLPQPATYANVAKISALYRVRQASDRAEILWHTDEVSECSLSFVTVKG